MKKFGKVSFVSLLITMIMLTAVACGSKEDTKSDKMQASTSESNTPITEKANDTKKKDQSITAAGSSFINPLFSKMFAEYNVLHPEIRVNYQSIGSGGGITQLTKETIDFAASDAFMNDEKIQAVKNGIIHIPVTVGAEAIIYNVDGVSKGLKLTQQTLAEIFLGTITKWNDPKLMAVNSDLKLPDLVITPVFRSDGSGTTAIFTDYLCTVSPEWKEKIGKGTSVKFPVGVGGKGNEGISGQVKQTPGSIGYTELAYATNNNIDYAQLKNKDGNFVFPSLEAATLAAETAAKDMPEDTRVSIVEKAGEKSYGIVGFTWVLLNTKYDDGDKKNAILDLIKWVYRDGQQYSEPLLYAKIPESIAILNDKNISKIQ